MITYTWKINKLETIPAVDNYADVVIIVHWQYMALDSEDEQTAEIYGSVNLGAADFSNFTPFADLTQTQVEGWLENVLDVAALKDTLQKIIESKRNPPTVIQNPPWG